jgi:hypothetical protein
MQFFKRNQVEEAISRTLGERSKAPSADLIAQIKRLLDTDRSESKELSKSAFITVKGEKQGHENQFSSYDAFALLLGVQMLQIGWSQTQVVKLLKRGRRELELFFRRLPSTEPPKAAPKASDPAVSGSPAVGILFPSYDRTQTDSAKILTTIDAASLIGAVRTKAGQSISVFAVASKVELERHLERALPRKRGRA